MSGTKSAASTANTGQCIVAMIAAVDAAAETLHTYPDGTTIQ